MPWKYAWAIVAWVAVLAVGCAAPEENHKQAEPDPVDSVMAQDGFEEYAAMLMDLNATWDYRDLEFDGPYFASALADVDDERLYAGAARAIITPTATNHPAPWYLGGTDQDRVATGVHDDLTAGAIVLRQGDAHAVLVSLDLVGFPIARVKAIREELALHGFDPEHIFIASSHTHESPDTMGIWGKDYFNTGADPVYAQFLTDTIVNLVLQAAGKAVPVSMRAGAKDVFEPDSNYDSLIRDSRDPRMSLPTVSAAQFVDDNGATVATLVNWHTHPEVMISTDEVSADFPQYLRHRLDDLLGGVTVYISGAVGGLATPLGVRVPGRDGNSQPMVDGNGQAFLYDGQSWEKARSLGIIVAEYVTDALDDAPLVMDAPLTVRASIVPLPIRNPVHAFAFYSGLVERTEGIIRDLPWFCGIFGCAPERAGYVEVGPLTLVTSPGETFAETVVGRDEMSIDYGPDWGVHTYPAITGYEELMDAEVTMHMGLCGDEIGYLVPQGDRHPSDHPENYEEFYSLGRDVETVYRWTAYLLVMGLADQS